MLCLNTHNVSVHVEMSKINTPIVVESTHKWIRKVNKRKERYTKKFRLKGQLWPTVTCIDILIPYLYAFDSEGTTDPNSRKVFGVESRLSAVVWFDLSAATNSRKTNLSSKNAWMIIILCVCVWHRQIFRTKTMCNICWQRENVPVLSDHSHAFFICVCNSKLFF